MARARAKFVGGGNATPEPVTAPEPVAEAKPEPEAPVAEAAPEAPSAKESARLAKMAVDLKERNAEALKLRNELKARDEKYAADNAARDSEMAKLKAQLDAIMKDPRAALKAHGGYDSITKKVLAGELKMPSAEEVMAEQVAERMTPLEQRLADLQAKLDAKEAAEAKAQQEAQTTATRTRDLGVVQQFVESASDNYPLVAALPGGHEWLLNLCYQNQTQDIDGQAKALEEHLASQATAYLQSPKALARLKQVSPKVRETIEGQAPNQSRKNPVSSEGPRVLARDVVSAPTTPIERPKTQAERKARATAILFGKT